MKMVRRLYDWVLSWADTPYGAIALFFIAFAESSFFPIPPDVLLIPLCLGKSEKCFRYAVICTAGSVLGGIAGYGIGLGLWATLDTYFYAYIPGFNEVLFNKIGTRFEQGNFWFVFTAAFTPIPFKIITISAGAFKLNFLIFLVATIIGRAARFFLVAGLIKKFGEPVRTIIDKWFNLLSIAFVILLVAGFYLIKVVMH